MGRPIPNFHGFFGQRRLVLMIFRLIRGALACGESIPSLMLLGPSGVGKTRFVAAITKEARVKLHAIVAAKSIKVRCLIKILCSVRPGDLFFIDEAHSLGIDEQQALYLALDEWNVPAVESGKLDPAKSQPIGPFCLILATNRPGDVLPALRRRLQKLEFRPYSVRELTCIAQRGGENNGLELTPQAARRLAEVAHGTPASVGRRLDTLRLSWPGRCQFSQKHIERVLRLEGIDKFGFTPDQRVYLRVLAGSPRGRNTLRRLAVHLGVDTRYVADDIEPPLIYEGYVDANEGPRRQLTSKGQEIVIELDAARPNNQESTDEKK